MTDLLKPFFILQWHLPRCWTRTADILFIFEWIMGNFFPMMVMGLFSVFWLSFGLLQLPTLQLAAAY